MVLTLTNGKGGIVVEEYTLYILQVSLAQSCFDIEACVEKHTEAVIITGSEDDKGSDCSVCVFSLGTLSFRFKKVG